MAPRLGANDPPITRRCTDGSSRDLHVRTRRAQRGAVAGRRRTREEAACLEASKACPGSNFPYAEFQRLVKFYRDGWDASVEAKARIAAFKLKPYLFVLANRLHPRSRRSPP